MSFKLRYPLHRSTLRTAVALTLLIGASEFGVPGPAEALDGSLRGAEGYSFGTFEKLGTSFCNADGSGEIHYTASHPLSGPLGGMITTSAVVTLGESGSDGRRLISDLSGTFEITGGPETITGLLSLAPPRQATPGGTADFMNQAYCSGFNDAYFQVTARFTASDSGGVFEEGFVKLAGANSRPVSPPNLATAEFWVAPEISIYSSTEIDEGGMQGSSHEAPQNVGGQPLTISVFPAPIDPLEVRLWTGDDTAVAGEDYTSVDETVLIPGIVENEYFGSQTVVVVLTDDNEAEGLEQFNATFELLSGHAFTGTSSTTAQIVDNDSTSVSIADVSLSEGNPGDYPNVTVEVEAAAPVTAPVYGCLAFAGGGAIPDDGTPNTDYYRSASGCRTSAGDQGVSMMLHPGQVASTTAVGFLLGDADFESDETIELVVDWIWGAPIPGDGTVTVTILNDDTEPADANGDGVDDLIGGGPLGSFNDGSGTFGQIVTVPGGLFVTVSDVLGDGVRVRVGGASTEKVTISACGFTLKLNADSEVVITCGSVTVEVVQGSVGVELGSGLAVVAIPPGAEVRIDGGPTDGFVVDVLSVVPGSPVVVNVDGVTTSIQEATTKTVQAWDFVGFDQPVDGGSTVNRVKAGRSVPLKWRLLDASGTPVLNLASAELTFLSTSCNGSSFDTVEETVTAGSGLQNLGNGRYQLNWKSPSAKGCGTLQLDVGDGVLHTARFQLT